MMGAAELAEEIEVKYGGLKPPPKSPLVTICILFQARHDRAITDRERADIHVYWTPGQAMDRIANHW